MSGQLGEGTSQSLIGETSQRSVSDINHLLINSTLRTTPQGTTKQNRTVRQRYLLGERPVPQIPQSRSGTQVQSQIRPLRQPRSTGNLNQNQINSPRRCTNQNNTRQSQVQNHRWQGRYDPRRDGNPPPHHPAPQLNTGQQQHGQANSKKSFNKGFNMNQLQSSTKKLRYENKEDYSLNEDQDNNRQRRRRAMGFQALEEIANSDPKDAIAVVNARKDSFLQLINSKLNKRDMYFLVLQILSKVSQSSFDELKSRLLIEVCHSELITNLRNYLMDLPYNNSSLIAANRFYWDNQEMFWENFIIFSEAIFDIAPSVALHKCRTLIEATTKYCLDELKTRHSFSLSVENQTRLTNLHKRLSAFEQKNVGEEQRKRYTNEESEDNEPPEDFRQLSVVPKRNDLLEGRPYVRANVVRGAYRDVEHYLDVQFRLLREDCFGPVRVGMQQFIDDPNKKEYDNIRVYRDVRFVEPYVGKNQIGITIQLDWNSMKRLRHVDWSHSKRFLFGSLLLFTNDYCQSFIATSIIDRDIKYLAEGKIPVRVIENEDLLTVTNIDYKSTYIMIESEVYFEPYQHVLKALQHPNFPTHLAMSQYIVKIQTETSPPSYVTDSLDYSVQSLDDRVIKFDVLNPLTWPSQEMLGFNESQFEAYKLALTHEFAVIQGPPGTGKTYLGVNVAKTLLNNVSSIILNNECVMLVICYTNHALDQFLEHILTITKSIVRVGGQSKNPAMEGISINTLRKSGNSSRKNGPAYDLFKSERYKLSLKVGELKIAQNRIKSLNDGIILYHDLQTYVPEAIILHQFYRQCKKDIIETWLFENMPYTNLQQILELNLTYDDGVDDGSNANRTDIDKDELWDTVESIGDHNEIRTCNILEGYKLNRLISNYNNCTDVNARKVMATEIQYLHSRMTLFKEMRDTYRANGVPRDIRVDEDLSLLSNIDRWSLYFSWMEEVVKILTEKVIPLQIEVNSAITACEEAKMILDLDLLRNAKVVGMTTSGAARQRKLLVALAPPIVIVEEAAEVLEQHIVTSLTSSCRHLILIGDHQQLRPSVAFMRLARHYNIDVSLFERMVLNGMHSRRLSVQHRMRPEIAALISPHVYPDLANHSSVENFPHVRGMTTDLFFYTHNYKEDKTPGDHTIRSNQKEAEVVLGLANYLMQQDYEPSDVTILAAYVGQMFYMKKQSKKYPFLNGVKITVVDNYQGEESKIILLSLVRNNDQNKIGFLGTDNRICVALSRAKEGFYIFGNINTLTSNSKLWAKINQTLEDKGSIGTELRLQCENHPNQLTTIKTVDDFNTVPEGGCLLKCNYNLPDCDHRCPRVCHGYDLKHTDTICQQDCERVICELGHVCPLKCAEKCKPCMYLVKKTLPCGHDKQVACHLKPDDSAIMCTVEIDVTLPLCGHEAKKQCYVSLDRVCCPVPCVYRLDGCGHACRRSCHVADDPDHEKYLCQQRCARAKKDCSANLEGDLGDHQCPKLCHETCTDCTVKVNKKRSTCKHSALVECRDDVNAKPCLKNCARVLPCKHFCKKKCNEPCGDCAQPVQKTIPECKHTIKLACMLEAKHEMCRKPCERCLPCGHTCPGWCGQPCDETACVEIIDTPVDSPCGHKVKLPCNVFNKRFSEPQLLLSHCSAPCDVMLKCLHLCTGSCSRCVQGRLHVPCTQPCQALNICGHKCEEPCNQLCPPCNKPCEVKCVHSKCRNICGAPCVPCQEACERSCPHGSCSRRCGAACARAACDQPCARALRCGHACRGLCGEPCPPICRICKPDDFPKDFLNDDFEEDTMFVQLEDCSHILAVEDADNLMQGDKETIFIRSCPFCRKPIINTYRYKDLINKMYKTEINPIKERIYGTKAQINEKREKFAKTLEEFIKTHETVLCANEYFKRAFHKLYVTRKQNKKVSILQIDMQLLYINILDMIGEKYKKFITSKLETTDFIDQVRLLCNFLGNNIQKISQQQQEDIRYEIKRLHCILQLSIIKKHHSYNDAKNDPKVMESEKKATSCVISLNVFEEHTAITALNNFSKAIKSSTPITMEERNLIVQALGLKQGHWFKCPNGHIYCITECGGAMEVGKCNECGEAIGGRSHQLLASNNLAREMDGARFAAWSEEYNNMNNFHLDID